MALHKLWDELARADMPASGKAFWIPSANCHLLEWGASTPSGTPASMLYINTAGTTTATVVYADVDGTWTAITVA